MTIQSVRQKPQYERKQGSNLLDKVGAAASLVGSFYSGPAAIAAVPAAAINAKRTFENTGYTQQVAPASRPEVLPAMDRRSQYQQEDPMQSLREAQAALASSQIDFETRQCLEAPILQALSERGGMA